MSLETWKAEFYPVPANEVPVDQALDHSIKKWSGLTKENMDKHRVHFDSDYREIEDEDDERLKITNITCALCYHHMMYPPVCHGCPILKHIERKCTDEYILFIYEHDPMPMIDLLNLVKAAQQ